MTLPPLFGPDFPSSVRDHLVEGVEVYWYHPDFTQSRYPPGRRGVSEACTLICLLVAQRISQSRLTIGSIKNCPKLNILIADSIIEGNTKHAWIVRNGLIPHPYLNTDEALRFGGRSLNTLKEWVTLSDPKGIETMSDESYGQLFFWRKKKFRVYRESIEKTLCKNIESFLHEWYHYPKAETLFMLLITCGRTVLFVFQEHTHKVTLFDSHGHKTPGNLYRGLVLAQTSMEKLQYLCDWYIEAVLHKRFSDVAEQYELAFLYKNCQPACCNMNTLCDCGCLDR